MKLAAIFYTSEHFNDFQTIGNGSDYGFYNEDKIFTVINIFCECLDKGIECKGLYKNSILDACTPQPGEIVFNTMRYRSSETVQRSRCFQSSVSYINMSHIWPKLKVTHDDAHQHTLTNVPTKCQPSIPYGIQEIAWTRF